MTSLQQLDAQLEELLAGWSFYTTILLIVLGAYLIYPLIFYTDPDTHPFLLARQSSGSRVRQPGETATYRALDTPHGYPLRSGLNVKDPGQPKWTAGRDGDLRDVWKKAALGTSETDGKPAAFEGAIKTVLGREQVLTNSFEQLSKEINTLGKHVHAHGSTRVAIYLSNSTELLVALMAACFYNFTPILIAQEQSLPRLATILEKTKADALIVGAGSVPLSDLLKSYTGLKQVVWVVARTSRHLDWNEVSEGEGLGKADISTWHEVVDEANTPASTELPASDPGSQAPNVILVSEPTDDLNDYEIVEFTQKNIVAGISAQLTSLPHAHRLSASDLLLPLAPLTKIYPLILTLTALYSKCSIALTSVTGSSASYNSAFNGVSPTVIIANPISLYTYEAKRRSLLRNGFFNAQRHKWLVGNLSKGIMPPSSTPSADGSPRLIYSWGVCYPEALSNLRIFTGARVILAFTDPKVAGAVSQTNMLDYRQAENLGPPLSCVETKLVEVKGRDIDGDEPQGKLVVTGPAVVGGETVVPTVMKVTDMQTLAYGEPVAGTRKIPVPGVEEHIEHALANPVAG